MTTQPRENSAILMRNPHQTLAKLKENWELCPDERNLTAFALLFSSLWLRDEPAFRMALRHIYTLGTLEVELAHNILFRTQSTLYPDMADICHRVWREEYQAAADGYDALPQIYKHLASRSAIHRERFRRGFFSTPYTLLRDGGNFCQAAPWLVANALQRDDSAQTLGRMLEPPATFSLPRQEARELLKTYVENYHWIMDAHNFPRLAALLNRVPQDAAHNDMIALIHQHIEFFGMFDNYTETEFAGIPDATHIIATKNTPWMEWLARLDQSSFQAAKNAAERVRNGANPKAALRGALQNAATPAALLVLWRAAREAGEKELADEFYNMAWRFH